MATRIIVGVDGRGTEESVPDEPDLKPADFAPTEPMALLDLPAAPASLGTPDPFDIVARENPADQRAASEVWLPSRPAMELAEQVEAAARTEDRLRQALREVERDLAAALKRVQAALAAPSHRFKPPRGS